MEILHPTWAPLCIPFLLLFRYCQKPPVMLSTDGVMQQGWIGEWQWFPRTSCLHWGLWAHPSTMLKVEKCELQIEAGNCEFTGASWGPWLLSFTLSCLLSAQSSVSPISPGTWPLGWGEERVRARIWAPVALDTDSAGGKQLTKGSPYLWSPQREKQGPKQREADIVKTFRKYESPEPDHQYMGWDSPSGLRMISEHLLSGPPSAHA